MWAGTFLVITAVFLVLPRFLPRNSLLANKCLIKAGLKAPGLNMKALCVLAFVELRKCCLGVLIISIVNDLPKQPFMPHFISFLGHLKWPVIELWYQSAENGEVVSEEGEAELHLLYHYCPIPRGVVRRGWAPWGEKACFTPFPGFKVWYQLTIAWPWPYCNQMKLQFTYKSGLGSLIKITGKRGFLNCSALSFLSQLMIISTGNNDFVKPISSIVYTFR